MGREARRAQARAERRAKRGQAQGGRRNPAAVPAQAAHLENARSRGSFFKPAWVTDIISELRKVTWPSRQEVGYLTVVVIVVSLVVGMILGSADLGFGWIVEKTILR